MSSKESTSFSEKITKFRKRIAKMADSFPDMTEEATKNALIMPFFNAVLGYDVFDPQEFAPEFVCDVGTKKGEKIDYAILSNGEPIILIEAKRAGMKLQKQQQGQLYRYFSVNRSRLAILTNGLQYNIYSDINAANVMDDDPFFSFNILNDDPEIFIETLECFCKEKLDIPSILSEAVYLKYYTVVEKTFRKDLESPSDDLVKYFLSSPEINTGKRITSHIINKYRAVTAEALRKVMGATINIAVTAPNTESVAPVEAEVSTSISAKIENALGIPLDVTDIYGGLKNAECTHNNKKYRIRWSENKPRYNVTEYYDNTYMLHFCNDIDDIVKLINQ
ncbi:MAG: type I restriction endonuclease [Oscillospiraceae bacterium]|nr:type I restriction endonuclease [Oscillospiraceae bacterium]